MFAVRYLGGEDRRRNRSGGHQYLPAASGGVTSTHILHGSCNTIGGQTQLIKLRWGANAEEMKFAGAGSHS